MDTDPSVNETVRERKFSDSTRNRCAILRMLKALLKLANDFNLCQLY